MKAFGKIFSLALLLAAFQSQAQVWPGDVNNNGIVNNIDLLFMAEVINQVGPPRTPAEQNILWSEKTIDTPWPLTLSNGLNAAFADCDGNGIIGFDGGGPPFNEDTEAIQFNYGETHGAVTPDVFNLGSQGVDPPLFFGAPSFPIFEGGVGMLSLQLGTPSQPVDDFLAIAFSIEYNPDLINGGGFVLFFDGNDFGPPQSVVFHQDEDAGRIDAAMILLGPAMSGSGTLAEFFIVIEDNVMDFTTPELPTELKIKDVKIISSDLSELPIYADSTSITIFNDDIVNNTVGVDENKIKIYPQPANEYLTIEHRNTQLEAIELFDGAGQHLRSFSPTGSNRTEVFMENLPSGMHILKMLTEEGWVVEKIVIQ